jgi:hypothetical protein
MRLTIFEPITVPAPVLPAERQSFASKNFFIDSILNGVKFKNLLIKIDFQNSAVKSVRDIFPFWLIYTGSRDPLV